MLRIYFTGEDIARTRIAHKLDPLWELVLATHVLRDRGDPVFAPWRAEAAQRLRSANLGARLNLMLSMMPPRGYFPDFLNPVEALHGLDEGLEAIRTTTRTTLSRDLARLADSHRLPEQARAMTSGPRPLIELTATMQTCYHLLISPHQQRMEAVLEQDRRDRMDAMADRGVLGLLDSLRPVAQWSEGELLIPGHRDQELYLNGRGLLLVPAYFCRDTPITMFDPDLTPVLVYPVMRQPSFPTCAEPVVLAALIGATRAAVLMSIGAHAAAECNTTLAQELGISMASVSEHTAILRSAGLIASHRDKNRILHRLTALGRSILTATIARPANYRHALINAARGQYGS